MNNLEYLPAEYGEGVWDRKSLKPIKANPYKKGTFKYESYNAGWTDTDKELKGK